MQLNTKISKGFVYLFDICFCPETPAPLQCAENFHVWILALAEALVLTAPSSRTHGGMALIEQHPVDTLRVYPTGVLISSFTVAAGDF